MLATARKRFGIVYRNRLSDWLDKWLFFMVFAVGAVGIVALKMYGWSQWVVIAFPLSAMGCYTAYVVASLRYRLREDLAGDGLYYLGFLYTLISLAYSLYAFTQDEGGTQVIISNFGIALATTIVGLALRVLFNQMREDPVEVEHEARAELSEAVARLKAELNEAVLAFNSFRRATVQSIDEGLKEIQNKVSTTLTESVTHYEETAKSMVEKLEEIQAKVSTTLTESVTRYAEVSGVVVGKIEAAFAEFETHAGKLNEIAKGTVAATKRLLDRVERIEAPTDLLEKKFTPVVEKLLTGMEQTLDGYNRTLAPQIKELAASMQQAIGGTKAGTAQIAQLQQLLEEGTKSAQTLEGHLTAWRTEDQKQTATIGKEVELLQQTLSKFRSEAEQNGQILNGLAKEAEAELGAVRTHRQALEAELNTSRKLVGEVHQSLVAMASLVVEKLNGR